MNKEHIYHLYPLGYAGANQRNNDGIQKMNLAEITGLIGHLKSMGITTLLLGPVFESESHGYDTVDYMKVDRRLGSNEDLKRLVGEFHKEGIKVMLDCVFNHVSRSHEIFEDIRNNRERSTRIEWLSNVKFDGDNSFGDGFSYENWDGHDILVKLNLNSDDVRHYLIDTALSWIDEYDIDGLRMDAADVMSKPFLRALGGALKERKKGFIMLGEVVHGDYNHWIDEGCMDAVTNYEAYKGLYSSLNDKNYFEIAYTLNRQFGPGGIYRQQTMYNFVDNHDVNRVASRLKEKRYLYPLYIMLYTMPGFPTIYYGSEFGRTGRKAKGSDHTLRPSRDRAFRNGNQDLYDVIRKLSGIRGDVSPLAYGEYKQVHIDHEIIGYERHTYDERCYIFVNAKEDEAYVPVPTLHGRFRDVLNDEYIECNGSVKLYGNWGRILCRA